jgi:hypothetical protein
MTNIEGSEDVREAIARILPQYKFDKKKALNLNIPK